MLYFIALAAAVEAVAAQPVDDGRLILWQSLREGMTADETATALRTVEGVKNVTVKTSKKGPSLSINYTGSGIEVAGLTYKVSTDFNTQGLSSVHLLSDACLGLAMEKYKGLRVLLADKYGEAKTQREVTPDRQLVAVRDTFTGTPTRVVIRLEPGEIPQRVYAGGSKFAASLAQISNLATDQAIAACPNDAGQRASIEIAYLDNADAAAIAAQEAASKSAEQEADKSKL